MQSNIIPPGTKVKVTNSSDLYFDAASREYIAAKFCYVVKLTKSGLYKVRLPTDPEHINYNVRKRNLKVLDQDQPSLT